MDGPNGRSLHLANAVLGLHRMIDDRVREQQAFCGERLLNPAAMAKYDGRLGLRQGAGSQVTAAMLRVDEPALKASFLRTENERAHALLVDHDGLGVAVCQDAIDHELVGTLRQAAQRSNASRCLSPRIELGSCAPSGRRRLEPPRGKRGGIVFAEGRR
jgi:hypothetical protein